MQGQIALHSGLIFQETRGSRRGGGGDMIFTENANTSKVGNDARFLSSVKGTSVTFWGWTILVVNGPIWWYQIRFGESKTVPGLCLATRREYEREFAEVKVEAMELRAKIADAPRLKGFCGVWLSSMGFSFLDFATQNHQGFVLFWGGKGPTWVVVFLCKKIHKKQNKNINEEGGKAPSLEQGNHSHEIGVPQP